jgi:hypothetical protein
LHEKATDAYPIFEISSKTRRGVSVSLFLCSLKEFCCVFHNEYEFFLCQLVERASNYDKEIMKMSIEIDKAIETPYLTNRCWCEPIKNCLNFEVINFNAF